MKELYPVIKSMAFVPWKEWTKTEIDNAVETLKCRASISCRDGKKEEVNAFSSFFTTWCDYLDNNPLEKKKMDPFYVLMSFNGLECSAPPRNLDQIILDYNQIQHVQQATKVDGSSFLYAFSSLVYAKSFDLYVRGRLNANTYVSRVSSFLEFQNLFSATRNKFDQVNELFQSLFLFSF